MGAKAYRSTPRRWAGGWVGDSSVGGERKPQMNGAVLEMAVTCRRRRVQIREHEKVRTSRNAHLVVDTACHSPRILHANTWLTNGNPCFCIKLYDEWTVTTVLSARTAICGYTNACSLSISLYCSAAHHGVEAPTWRCRTFNVLSRYRSCSPLIALPVVLSSLTTASGAARRMFGQRSRTKPARRNTMPDKSLSNRSAVKVEGEWMYRPKKIKSVKRAGTLTRKRYSPPYPLHQP